MPTEYTAIIKEKNITFREFTLRCAREIDYTMSMRDSPLDAEIPTKFFPGRYYPNKLRKLGVKLEDAEAMLPEEAERRAKEKYGIELRKYTRIIRKRERLEKRCRSLLENVKMWQPPTPEHVGLKDFMRNQLEDFMELDCSTDYCKEPKEQTGAEYKADLIRELNRKIGCYQEAYEKEVANAQESSEWVKKLRESLLEDGE